MMEDIKSYSTFTKVQQLDKGWSSDVKYYVKDSSGKSLLLRMNEVSNYKRKKFEFHMMQKVVELGVPMSQPLDFGVCNKGQSVYSLFSGWLLIFATVAFYAFIISYLSIVFG